MVGCHNCHTNTHYDKQINPDKENAFNNHLYNKEKILSSEHWMQKKDLKWKLCLWCELYSDRRDLHTKKGSRHTADDRLLIPTQQQSKCCWGIKGADAAHPDHTERKWWMISPTIKVSEFLPGEAEQRRSCSVIVKTSTAFGGSADLKVQWCRKLRGASSV